MVLQASDGRQAVCVLVPGRLSSPTLVPSKVLPGRQGGKEAVIELLGDQWQSSDGKTEPDEYAGDSCYPALAEVLPEMPGKPFSPFPVSLFPTTPRSLSRSGYGSGTTVFSSTATRVSSVEWLMTISLAMVGILESEASRLPCWKRRA